MDSKLKLICEVCDKVFYRYKNRDYKTISCSKKCYHISRIGKSISWKRPKKVLMLVSCSYCSLPIERWRFELNKNKNNFCNRYCMGKYRSIHNFSEKAFNWKGGKYSSIAKQLTNSRYRRIRESVIQLDNRKCQLCSSKEKLEVHHIIEKGKNPSLIFDITNMITLCKPCHCKIRGYEKDYVGLFDGIVANRPNSVEPRTGNTEPSMDNIQGVCRDQVVDSKEMV